VLLGVFAVVHTTASAPATSPDDQKYDEFFKKYTARYFGNSADWRVFKAQAIVESGLRPTVVSPDKLKTFSTDSRRAGSRNGAARSSTA